MAWSINYSPDITNPVGGAYSHGDSVTITGSGFGTHALNFSFNGGAGGPIEGTAVGVTPNDADRFIYDISAEVGAAAVPVIYNDATRLYVLRHGYNDGFDLANAFDYGSTVPANVPFYFSWWVNLDPFTRTGGTVYQWKFARFRATLDVSDDPTNGDSYFANWVQDFDNSFVDFLGGSGGFSYINGTTTPYNGSSLPYNGQGWHRIEWYGNTPNGASAVTDSFIRISRAGSFTHRLVSEMTNFTMNRNLRYLVFQNYIGVGDFGGSIGGDSRIMQDDQYVQFGTLKRVELADTSSISSANWREIQDIESWSDTSIQVKLNTGAQRTGTLYLHPLAENGTTIGSALQITVE